MPRQDVPYGGAICRLKERIAELFDLVGQKLHSINGVEGDGQGNVEIVSGDAAITISDSQPGHYIEIGLDHGALPSAAVSSVNEETGAVVLDGNDIDSGLPGGLTVADELGSNRQQLQVVSSLMQQEVLDRQNADSALQTNINQVQAGIPAAAAAAVANDPTVAQLAADVPNKVDKITSGSTKRAYTHTGAVQDDTPVVNGTDANSIGLRDANGRMYAADPASGATDKTLATTNWISQTGDTAPNNLVHKTGSETIIASKFFAANPHIKKTDPSYTEILLDDNIKRTEFPENTHRFGIRAQDSDNITKAALSIWSQTDGSIWLVMEAYPIINGVATYKRKELLKFNIDGTITVMT